MKAKKTKKASIERWKPALLLAGLTLAGATSLAALEFISIDEKQVQMEKGDMSDLDLEPTYVMEEPETPEPEQPEPEPEDTPPITPPADDTQEAENDSLVKNVVIVPPDIKPPVIKPPVVKKKAPKVFDFPTQEATFQGGMEGMYEYLYSKITYPKMAKRAGIQGRVFVEFIVDENGNVTNTKILKGIGGGCDEQALEAVKSLPQWTPAEQAGTKVRQRFKLPIKFMLE